MAKICHLADVVYFAGLLAGEPRNGLRPQSESTPPAELDRYTDLLAEAAEDIAELRAAPGLSRLSASRKGIIPAAGGQSVRRVPVRNPGGRRDQFQNFHWKPPC